MVKDNLFESRIKLTKLRINKSKNLGISYIYSSEILKDGYPQEDYVSRHKNILLKPKAQVTLNEKNTFSVA